MGSVTDEDVHHLQKFLKSREAVGVVDAISIVARIVESAARPDAVSESSIRTAREVLADLHKNPSSHVIPKLLDICMVNTSFQVLDVFILTSAAWKALVAAFVSKDDSFPTETAFSVIQCALRSALMMLVRTVSVQHGIRSSDLPDIARCVRIAKFYLFNAAKCSKALLSWQNRDHSCIDLHADVLSHAMQLAAVTSHILLFDPVLDSSTLSNIQTELCPLVGTILGYIFHMIYHASGNKSSSKAVALFIKSRDKFAKTSNFLASCYEDITTHSFLLLAVLHVMRLQISQFGSEANDSAPRCDTLDQVWSFFKTCLLPTLFQLCEQAYAELIILRERTTGQTYLDTISSSFTQCVVVACGLRAKEDDRLSIVYFLLQQISDSIPASAHIAQECLQSIYEHTLTDNGRENLIAMVLRYLRVAFAIESSHLESRWIPLVTELLGIHFDRFGTEKKVSHFLCWTPREGKKERKETMGDRPDPLSLWVLSSLTDHMVNRLREASNTMQGNVDERHEESELFQKLLLFLISDEEGSLSPEELKKGVCKMCTSERAGAWAIQLIPYVLDAKSANAMALQRLALEAPLPEVCASLKILQPSSMTSKDIESVCKLSTSLLDRHGYTAGPAIAAFISKSSSMLHGSVSVADWQYLSDALDRTVWNVLAAVKKDPHWSILSSTTLYHAAVTLSNIRLLSVPQKDKQTLITLPDRILQLAEQELERLKISKHASLTLGGRGLVNERLAAEREIRVVRAKARTIRRNSSEYDMVETLRMARLSISETLCDILNERSGGKNHLELKAEIRNLQVLLEAASQLIPDVQNEIPNTPRA
eukprot:TRINITY_DN2938_c0_g1_i1.p1 TRINITY_DN2938_c0_g1~~TRINITY_DN2938_c0_g1_i1.p1  ORF type:complete len:823 (-),score=99.76 TRINITY_DN2938_c0_g1_i1:936-3404(-)